MRTACLVRFGFLLATIGVCGTGEAPGMCGDKLAVYKLVFETFWSRDLFPKHYPEWKPAAQWTKLIGRSHNLNYTLFRLGQKSSIGVKTFAENGNSEILDETEQGENGVFDSFVAPLVPTGVGRTETRFFVDGNHSKVSLLSRMVPSPDWFVGIDSFELCVGGNWLDSVIIEVDPLDAGTDNGFTFTAPDWPTEPRGEIYRITANYPEHPAGSFFYPHLKNLPAIGSFKFIKLSEYELNQIFHFKEKINANTDHESQNTQNQGEEEEKHQKTKKHTFDKITFSTPFSATPLEENGFYQVDNKNYQHDTSISTALPTGNKTAIIRSIANSYIKSRKTRRNHKNKKFSRRLSRHCRVSKWSPWSECSAICGIGETKRHREVLWHPRGGRNGEATRCPPLVETRWCVSQKPCGKDTLSW